MPCRPRRIKPNPPSTKCHSPQICANLGVVARRRGQRRPEPRAVAGSDQRSRRDLPPVPLRDERGETDLGSAPICEICGQREWVLEIRLPAPAGSVPLGMAKWSAQSSVRFMTSGRSFRTGDCADHPRSPGCDGRNRPDLPPDGPHQGRGAVEQVRTASRRWPNPSWICTRRQTPTATASNPERQAGLSLRRPL